MACGGAWWQAGCACWPPTRCVPAHGWHVRVLRQRLRPLAVLALTRLCIGGPLPRPQNHYVYVFEHPDAGAAAAAENAPSSSSCSSGSWGGWDLRAEQMLVGSLGEASPHWGVRPVNFFSTQQHAAGARVSQQHRPPEPGDHGSAEPALPPEPRPQRAAAAAASAAWQDLARGGPVKAGACSYGTVTLGPFPVPCNLAAASPDGRWVAVVGDSQALYLVDQQAGYSWRTLAFDLAGSHDRVEEGLEAGECCSCCHVV